MKIKQILLVALISAVISVCSVFVYDKFFSQKIVTFDLRGYIGTLRDLYVTKQIDDNELRKRLDKIEEIVKSTPKRKVIITSDVILGGDKIENLTPKISGVQQTRIPSPETQSSGTSK